MNLERDEHVVTCRSQSSQNHLHDVPQIPVDNNFVFNDYQLTASSFALDNQTVKNIVEKIILKELSNSEDDIFMKNSGRSVPNNFINNNCKSDFQPDDDECILSDVLSVKDLKIPHHMTPFGDISNNQQVMSLSQISGFPVNPGFPPQNPKSKSKKIHTSHSVDNLSQ